MSWRHIKAVWSSSRSKGAARLVMLCLADHANDSSLAWPGTELIAEETQVSERQVQRAIDSLVTAGEITIVEPGNGRGNSTVYRFLLPLKGDTMSPNDQPLKGDISSIKGDMVSERVTFETKKGDMVSPEVLREKPTERTEKEGDRPRPPIVLTRLDPSRPYDAKVIALLEVSGLDQTVPDHRAQADNTAAQLARYAANYIQHRYTRPSEQPPDWNWYFDDWRGRNGEMPTLKTIVETIGKSRQERANGRASPAAQSPPLSNTERAAVEYARLKQQVQRKQ